MDSNWAPGFRFHPTEEELISFYLQNKLEGTRPDLERVIPTLDIYSMDPWQLPQFSGEFCREDPRQWFFLIPRQARDALGGKTSRTTSSGYWKATGSPGYAYSSGSQIIGVKKSMVFYEGKVSTRKKTEWKMNEYRAFLAGQASSTSTSTATPNRILRLEYSLCRVYVGSGRFRAVGKRPSRVTRSEMPLHLHQPDAFGGATCTISPVVTGNMATPSPSRQKTPKIQKTSNKLEDWSTFGDGDDAHPPQIVWDIIDDGL